MTLGGNDDVLLLSNAGNVLDAITELHSQAEAAKDPRARSLLEAKLHLGELVQFSIPSKRRMQAAFGKVAVAAGGLLESTALALYPGIAKVYEALVTALRGMGEAMAEEAAAALEEAAGMIRLACLSS